MNDQIKKDLFRYVGNDCHRLLIQLRYIFFTPGFRYTYYMRKVQQGGCFKFFWMGMQRLCMERTLIQIPYQTQIGEGLYIGHFGHIIINPGCKIGKNFNIAAGVLIGNAQGKYAGTPTIGDNVKVGQNAIIIGKINIGNDVLVAPGAFVNFDVPDNCIVIGNPGKIIQRNSSPTVRYIVYPVQNY
ncbi:LbetaH domain-containing protein [Bacteroides congonensis]|uniref:serine acetyltransferase n=1 Tax=Bacteroides congonensis TaxID=1871006 RepID=UPI001896FCB6|nr:serine acetyltransferase [Bacteroides congonensis]